MSPELVAKIESLSGILEEIQYQEWLDGELDYYSGRNYDDTFEMGREVGYTEAVKEILKIIKEVRN